jgi:uncharacterized SAM-binding protein YcdF (DUF218 family)
MQDLEEHIGKPKRSFSLRRDGHRELILVTSLYHTRRTHLAFSHFAGKRRLEIYVYGSNDNTGLRGLMLEYAKYLSYRVF